MTMKGAIIGLFRRILGVETTAHLGLGLAVTGHNAIA